MTTTNTFICPYCGEEKDRAGDSVEHPMPRALGGHGFSSRGFCNVCNPRAGQEVDRPFVEHFSMVALRHKFGVRDGRGQVPPAPPSRNDSRREADPARARPKGVSDPAAAAQDARR
jgi:HNH endonuclease